MSTYPKKLDDGRWLNWFRVGDSNSPRIKKIFKTKVEALQFEREEKTRYAEGCFEQKSFQDNRRLKQLIEEWYRLYGNQLRYNVGTKNKLNALAERINNPIARQLTVKHIVNDRANRIESGLKVNSANRDVTYLKAMFNKLIELGDWKYENPIQGIKKLKIDQTEMIYLELDEIDYLLWDMESNGRNPDTLLVTKICLATGARWSEAEQLKPKQFVGNRITFIAESTKGRKHRTVLIDDELAEELRERAKGLKQNQRIFDYCYSAYRKGIERCKIELPEGQMSHVLRHSFASHYVIQTGDITGLQEMLGHANITTTMRYNHLRENYLDAMVTHNPLALLKKKKNKSG